MEITYLVIIGIVTGVLGAFTKAFVDSVPNRFIPLQNVLIGLISAGICVYAKIETDMLKAIVLCLTATMSTAGLYDLTKIIKGGK